MGNAKPSGNPDLDLSSFKLLSQLGKGAFGRVYLARKTHGAQKGQLFALKQFTKRPLMRSVKNAFRLLEERSVMEAFGSSPFLVTLHYAFVTDATVNLVMELAIGGDLQYHRQRRGKFSEKDARFYIAEIVLALETLHRLKVIHRDLKTENVMLDRSGHVLLTDFGLSKIMKATDTMAARPCTFSFCGTREIMAPEIILSIGYGFCVDWFSLGVLAYELMANRRPFTFESDSGRTDKEYHYVLYDRILNHHPPLPDGLSSHAHGFLTGLLQKDPWKRLGDTGTAAVKQHSFFKDLDWIALESKNISPPFTPNVKDDTDVTNFWSHYTRERVPRAEGSFCDAGYFFEGFDYVAPS